MSRNGSFFFSRFEYHTLYVLYPVVTYLLTLPRIYLLTDVSNSNYTEQTQPYINERSKYKEFCVP
jgi:hypothetical protein